MNRRKFLILAGIGTGGVVVPASLYYLSPSIKEYATLLIKQELNYLKLENGSVEQYVSDYFKNSKNDLVFRLKWKTMYYLKIDSSQSTVLFELVKYYLLSSNFFINRTDMSQTVKYLGLYSPYKSPVPNPFSFVLYPPVTIKDV